MFQLLLLPLFFSSQFSLELDPDTSFLGRTASVLPNCFTTPNAVCIDGGQHTLNRESVASSLIAFYSFDDLYGLDHSGNANHALSPPPSFAPGHDPRGQSASFTGNDNMMIPHSPAMDSMQRFTVSFWIYLTSDSTDLRRVVFRKGSGSQDVTPTLFLSDNSRTIYARLRTSDSSRNSVTSITSIPLRRWTHVAVTVNYNLLTIFINGVKDSQGTVSGEVLYNTGPWYLGKDAYLPGTGMFLDDFKIYAKSLDEREIQEEAQLALPGLGPNFLRLGCKSCTMSQAQEHCATLGGYHLCKSLELNGGGLMAARAMGYLSFSSGHWAAEDEEPIIELNKLGLCCID